MIPLFADENIYNELHLLICQPPSGKHIIVHGSSSKYVLLVLYITVPNLRHNIYWKVFTYFGYILFIAALFPIIKEYYLP